MIAFPQQEFEIELEGSQCLRILCYEKCYDKSKLNKDDNEIVDKIVGKGQVQVRKAKRRPLRFGLYFDLSALLKLYSGALRAQLGPARDAQIRTIATVTTSAGFPPVLLLSPL